MAFASRRTVGKSYIRTLGVPIYIPMDKVSLACASLALVLAASACASQVAQPPRPGSRSDPESPMTAEDLTHLEHVYKLRTLEDGYVEYPIGPGDLIELSVPDMPELREVAVRVSATGTISLPVLGDVPAAGRSEAALSNDILRRLRHFMHDPELEILVREYHNRQVAVVGMVKTAGTYDLTGTNETILDMIAAAGGLTDQASDKILFVPAGTIETSSTQSPITAAVNEATSTAKLRDAPGTIEIDLAKLNDAARPIVLSVPVRPGDVIVALGGGQVYVQGWVEKPGTYRLATGMRLLGAIAGAGGPSFPADVNEIKVYREDDHEKAVLIADLEDIQAGRERDPLLHDGDVIQVDGTAGKLATYGFYGFFTTLFRVGATVPIF